MTVIGGYERRFDLCLDYGRDAEHFADSLLAALFQDASFAEVKHDSRVFVTGNLYIEYESRGRDGKWYRSGIATSQAQYWCFVLGDTHFMLLMPTLALRDLARELWRTKANRVEQKLGENPTRGIKLRLADLVTYAASEPFDATRRVLETDPL